jgi:hypothetical protein
MNELLELARLRTFKVYSYFPRNEYDRVGAIHRSGREMPSSTLGTFSRRAADRLAPAGKGRSPRVDGARGTNDELPLYSARTD